jgi:hypothetical protein
LDAKRSSSSPGTLPVERPESSDPLNLAKRMSPFVCAESCSASRFLMSESKPYERKPFVFLHLPPDFCPKYSTLDEACSYARHGRWQGHQKIRRAAGKASRTAAAG